MNRNSAKWAPFNSVIIGEKAIEYINDNKKEVKPILSTDQIEELENKILSSYSSKAHVSLFYYYNYKIKNIDGIINKINTTNKTIYINDKKILFSNITNIKELDT